MSMKKTLSIFAVMLCAGAVFADTDFAAPGYSCAADDAVLTVGNSSHFYLDKDADPHHIAWADAALSENNLAAWTVTATRGCYVTVSLDLGPVIASNKHIFEVKILDDKSNVKGTLAEPAENTDANQVKELEGTILLPVAGTYTVELRNNRDWGKGSIKNVILTYAADAPSEIVDVTSVELNKTELALQLEEVEQLFATVLPEDATDPSVTWESSDEAVATVVDGFVTAIAEGTATIKAKAGEKEATCAVTVAAVAIPDVNFAAPYVLSAKKAQLEGKIWKMYKNDTYKLYGDGGSNKQYGNAIWTVNVTKPCILSGVLNGVEGGHLFELDLYKGEELVATIAHPADKAWSKDEIALEGTFTITEAGNYTFKLRNTQEWSSGKVAGITLTDITPQTLYLKPGIWYYAGNNEKFAIYAWADGKEAYWSDFMELAENETAIWKGTIPADYTDVIFVRFGNAATTPSWEDNTWNKTLDLKIEEGKDLYTITGWGEKEGDPCPGEWSKYEYIEPAKFYIAGDGGLVGEEKEWKPDGIKVMENSYTFENLAAGNYQFKITIDGTWNTAKGFEDLTPELRAAELYLNGGNIGFTLAEAGDVTITYIEDDVFKVEGAFVLPELQLIGIKGWTAETDAIDFVPADNHLTANVTVTLDEKKDHEFKLIYADSWIGKKTGDDPENLYVLKNDWTTVDGLTGDGYNILLRLGDDDYVPGNYTFSWVYATGELTVIFPEGPTAIDNTEVNAKVVKSIENGMLIIIKNGVKYNAQGAIVK